MSQTSDVKKTPPKSRRGQRKKGIEEVLHFAFSHRTKVLVLSLLHEGVYTPNEISEITGVPLGSVSYHVKELLDAGSIELATVKKRRNADQHYYQSADNAYRAVAKPYWSDEEYAELTPQNRQVTVGLTIQSIVAELMAAFWGKKLSTDPRVWLTWDWFNLDAHGREELADEQARHWERVTEIEANSINRCAQNGGQTESYVVVSAGFERVRTAPKPDSRANAE